MSGSSAAKLALLLASLGLVAGGFELALHLSYPRVVPVAAEGEAGEGDIIYWTERGKRLVPNSRVRIRNHWGDDRPIDFVTNELGFRDDPVPVPKPPDELRILALGDSITLGGYLPAEEVFVERMERHLNQAQDLRRVRVINAGVNDFGLSDEINVLEEKGLAVEPDLVMVGFYMNDSRPPWGFPRELGSRGWLRQHSLLARAVYDSLVLWSWIREEGRGRFDYGAAAAELDWLNDRDELLELARLARFDWGAAWQESSWELVARDFDRLQRLSDSHGFEVFLVAFPVRVQVMPDYVEDAPQRRLARMAEARGWAFHDLLPTLRRYDSELVYVDLCHPSAAGSEIVGRELAEVVRSRLLPPARDALRSGRLEVKPGILFALLAASVLLVHWPPSDSDFAYDDREFVEQNASIRSLGAALGAFDAPFPPEQAERGLYRPLTNLSYAIDHALWGARAAGFHATNVALYLLVVLGVHGLVRAWGASRELAFCVALLFSLHPVHCEAVDAIAGRSELLALLFALAALALAARAETSPRGVPLRVAAAVAYAAACWSKESAALLPAVLAVQLWVAPGLWPGTRRLGPAGFAWRLAPWVALLAVYLAARFAVLGRLSPLQTVLAGHDLVTRLATAGAVFHEYLRLLCFPSQLQIDYVYQAQVGIRSGIGPQAGVGLLALAATGTALVLLLARGLRRPEGRSQTSAVAALALAIFVTGYLPVSHTLDFGALMAERFLFAPSLGFVLGLALGARAALRRAPLPAPRRQAVAVAALITLALAGGWRSAARAGEWRDETRLWASAAAVIPDDPRVQTNLGAAQLQRGRPEAARAPLRRALALDPDHLPALNNLGLVALRAGRHAQARAAFSRVVALEPGNSLAWNSLGVVATRELDHSRAARLFRRALDANPNNAAARRNLARTEQALARARDFLHRHPPESAEDAGPDLREEVAIACHVTGDRDCAERFGAAVLATRGGAPSR